VLRWSDQLGNGALEHWSELCMEFGFLMFAKARLVSNVCVTAFVVAERRPTVDTKVHVFLQRFR
jgi:hypothetical protein